MHFQLFDQYGVVQLLPATFLGTVMFFSIAAIAEIRRVQKLNVSKKDKLTFLSTLLTTCCFFPAWIGLLTFYPTFFREHSWSAIAPLYLYFALVLFGIKRNKDVIARIKRATDDSQTEEQKQKSRRQGRRAFWVIVALGVWAFVALIRWKP